MSIFLLPQLGFSDVRKDHRRYLRLSYTTERAMHTPYGRSHQCSALGISVDSTPIITKSDNAPGDRIKQVLLFYLVILLKTRVALLTPQSVVFSILFT